MIHAVVRARLFYRCNVCGFFHHADEPLVASGIRAVAARVNVRDVIAHGTKMKFFFKVSNG
jgi:hypothetical protein